MGKREMGGESWLRREEYALKWKFVIQGCAMKKNATVLIHVEREERTDNNGG